MKRFTKGCLKTALVLVVIGAAFGLASLCMGFRPADFGQAVEDGRIGLPAGNRWLKQMAASGRQTIANTVSKTGSKSTHTFDRSFSQVTSLELDAGVAECRVIPEDTEEWRVTGTGLPSDFSCSLEDGTLEIECSGRTTFLFGVGFGFGSQKAELEIHVPKDQVVDYVEINSGVGTLTIGGDHLKCRRMELECGVGESSIYADISESLEINGGIGEIYLNLKGCQEDFDYDLEGGIGEIEIGDTQYSGIGVDHELNHHASKTVIIENGIGEVQIDFSDYGTD